MGAMDTLIMLGALAVGGYVFVTYILPQMGNLQLPSAAAATPTQTYVEPYVAPVVEEDEDKSDRDLLEELLGEDLSRRETKRFMDYLEGAEEDEEYEEWAKDLPLYTNKKNDELRDFLGSKKGLERLAENTKAQLFGGGGKDDDDEDTIDELKKTVNDDEDDDNGKELTALSSKEEIELLKRRRAAAAAAARKTTPAKVNPLGSGWGL